MTKNELKSALTEAGIEFKAKAKANLETLQGLYDAHFGAKPATPPVDDFTMSDEELAGQAGRPKAIDYATASYDEVANSDCPGCGIHLSNGLLAHTDEAPNSKGVTLHQAGLQTHAYSCMGCGAEFGQDHGAYVAPAKSEPTGTGLKIEKDRIEQNGIKRPSIGGKCRAIWDALDEYRAETGELPTSKTVKELAADSGWNPNNASIEFYQWRKFHGIGKQA